jgi:predicted ATPase
MIAAISLLNFKGFKSTQIPMSNLTLLSGLNGSGKSTVLQALGLLRQSHDARFPDGGDLALNGDLVELGTVKDILNHSFDEPQIGIAITDNESEEVLNWVADADGQFQSDVLICNEWAAPEACDNNTLFRPGLQFLRADRITPAVIFPKSLHAIRHNRFLGPKGEFTAHYLLEFGSDMVVAEHLRHESAGASTSMLGHVNAWLQEFSPGVRVEPYQVEMTDLVRLEFTYRGTSASYGDPIRPTNVGFGLTHVLPVVAACLGSDPGSLLIVENPEAQLHPQGQFALGRLLALTAASGVQVIAESHSDHVLNGIRLAIKGQHLDPSKAAFHFFSRLPEGEISFESPKISPDGRLSQWPSGFFDQWERSLDLLLE